MVLVSRRLEDLKKSLGLGLEQKVLGLGFGLGLDGMVLVLVLRLKSCNFQDFQLFLLRLELCPIRSLVFFASYQRRAASYDRTVTELMHSYLASIQSIAHGHEIGIPWKLVKSRSQLRQLMPLLEYVFCGPCTSAPVERVFSHSGIFVRPHRASLSDRVCVTL